MDYQNPGLTYENLDQNTAVTPQEPSVNDPGLTYEGLDQNTVVVPAQPTVYDELNNY